MKNSNPYRLNRIYGVFIVNEIFITANELSKITGKPLFQVIEAIKTLYY